MDGDGGDGCVGRGDFPRRHIDVGVGLQIEQLNGERLRPPPGFP